MVLPGCLAFDKSPCYTHLPNKVLGEALISWPGATTNALLHSLIGFSLPLKWTGSAIVLETIDGGSTVTSQTVNHPVGPTAGFLHTASMSSVPMAATSADLINSPSVAIVYFTPTGKTYTPSVSMAHLLSIDTTHPLTSTIYLHSTTVTYPISAHLTYSPFIALSTDSPSLTDTPIPSLPVTSSGHQVLVQSSVKDGESGTLLASSPSKPSSTTLGPAASSGATAMSSGASAASSSVSAASSSTSVSSSSASAASSIASAISTYDLATNVTPLPASFFDIFTPTSGLGSDRNTDEGISLLFVFVMLVMSLLLLIGLALVLLLCLCFCQRRSKKSLGQNNGFSPRVKANQIPLGVMEVVQLQSRAHSETNETFQQSAAISSRSTEPEGLFLLAHNQATTFTEPQELLAYNVSQNSQSLPLPPITPRNSVRGSILQQFPAQTQPVEIGDEDDYDEPETGKGGIQSSRPGSRYQQQQSRGLEHGEYMEPTDTLNPSPGKSGQFNPYEDDIEPELGPRIVKSSPTPTESDAKSTSTESDCHDYDHIYCEVLEPSMMKEAVSPVGQAQDSLPYAPIYDLPKGSRRYNHPFHISPRSIKIIQQLGIGQFGKVFLAATIGVSLSDLQLNDDNDRTRSLLVAVKQLKSSADQKLKSNFHKEIRFMIRLKHANVIRLLAICTSTATPFLMMEYMENGDLNEFLRKQQLRPDSVQSLDINEVTPMILVYISVQIASGMRYLASKQFIHRDLAARNCLVGRDFVIKISDFGMSRNLYQTSYYRITGHLILPIRWMASETFFGRFSVKSDSWAYGITVCEIFTLCENVPYHDMTDQEVIGDAIRGASRKILPKPDACPDEVYDVMKRCFVHQPAIRGDFEEIYSRMFMVYSTLSQQA